MPRDRHAHWLVVVVASIISGGLAIQAPDDALNPAMPRAAIAACRRARVLPAGAMRRHLLELAAAAPGNP